MKYFPIAATACLLAVSSSSLEAASVKEFSSRLKLINGVFHSTYALALASPTPGVGESAAISPTPAPSPVLDGSPTPTPKPTPDPDDPMTIKANEAVQIIAGGGNWNSLSSELQLAYSNVYPEQAVVSGRAAALNLMDSGVLTPEIVSGYVNNGGTWIAPRLTSGGISASDLKWGDFKVVRITDPLQPAEVIGNVSVLAVVNGGAYRGSYCTGSLLSGVEGVTVGTEPSNFGSGYGSMSFTGGTIMVIPAQ